MKNFRENRPRYLFKNIILPVILCLLVLGVFIAGIAKFSEMSAEQNRELTLSAVQKAAVQCYADEGRYPSDVAYLEEKYGLTIDHDSFMVVYDCPAANVNPNIRVYRRKK